MPYQNYYYPTAATTPARNPLGLKGRPVTSLEEVRAAAVDFDGSVSFFPDLANGKIYTKQCNIDGTASLNMYELKEIPTVPNPNSDYVTREEFNTALTSLKQALNQANLEVKQSLDQTQQSPQTSNLEFKF